MNNHFTHGTIQMTSYERLHVIALSMIHKLNHNATLTNTYPPERLQQNQDSSAECWREWEPPAVLRVLGWSISWHKSVLAQPTTGEHVPPTDPLIGITPKKQVRSCTKV